MSTQGTGVYKINAGWYQGEQYWYEKAYGRTTTGDIFKLGTTAVTVGNTAQDIDFEWKGTGSVSAIFDCGDSSFTLVGVDAKFYGATASAYMLWDESADDLVFSGVAGISGSTTTGSIAWTASTLNATTGRIASLKGTIAAPNLGDGYGAVEDELTASGTVAGTFAAASTWINFAEAAVPGGNLICTHNDGIWLPSGITASSATMIIGARMQYVASDGANPGSLYLWSTNIYDNVLTAMLHVNTIVDLGGSTGAVTQNAYKIPLFKDVTANKVWYVNVYDN